MIGKIKSIIIEKLNMRFSNKLSLWGADTDSLHVKHSIIQGIRLAKDEKEEIKKLWSKVVYCPIERGYEYYLGLKCLRGFDPRYLPLSYFYPYFEAVLNPVSWKRILSHKGLSEMLYGNVCKLPVTIIRSIGGKLFDRNYDSITIEDAAKLIRNSSTGLLYKPSLDTQQGKGIRFYSIDDRDKLIEKFHNGDILCAGTDFVIQVCASQSDETKIFNTTSLNCVRITTLNLNGRVSVCSRALKLGQRIQ